MTFVFKKPVAKESLTTAMRRDEQPTISTTSNDGNVKLNEEACKLIGVPFGAVATPNKADAGVRVDFKVMEVTKDGSKQEVIVVVLLPLGSKEGNKLASASKQEGGNLQCSSAKLWNFLGGNDKTLINYEISRANTIAAMSEDGSVATLANLEEGGYISDNKYTTLAEEAGLGTAGSIAEVFYVLTKVGEEPKREVTVSDKPRKIRKAKDAGANGEKVVTDTTIENPFPSDGLEAKENEDSDVKENPFGDL